LPVALCAALALSKHCCDGAPQCIHQERLFQERHAAIPAIGNFSAAREECERNLPAQENIRHGVGGDSVKLPIQTRPINGLACGKPTGVRPGISGTYDGIARSGGLIGYRFGNEKIVLNKKPAVFLRKPARSEHVAKKPKSIIG
jgi:hypothetical protein